MIQWAGSPQNRVKLSGMRENSMRSSLLAAFVALIPVSAATAQTAPFDLACEGVRVTELDGPQEPYTYGFRIDLDAGRWCWSTCERTFEINELGPDLIILHFVDEDGRSVERWTRNEINRQNGEHELLSIDVRPMARFYNVKGVCAPQPFSGFPAALF
jgi:hypothetical protein